MCGDYLVFFLGFQRLAHFLFSIDQKFGLHSSSTKFCSGSLLEFKKLQQIMSKKKAIDNFVQVVINLGSRFLNHFFAFFFFTIVTEKYRHFSNFETLSSSIRSYKISKYSWGSIPSSKQTIHGILKFGCKGAL